MGCGFVFSPSFLFLSFSLSFDFILYCIHSHLKMKESTLAFSISKRTRLWQRFGNGKLRRYYVIKFRFSYLCLLCVCVYIYLYVSICVYMCLYVCMLSSDSILVNVENQMVKNDQTRQRCYYRSCHSLMYIRIRKKSKPKSIYLNQSDEIKVKRKHLSDQNTNKWKANKARHSSKWNEIKSHRIASHVIVIFRRTSIYVDVCRCSWNASFDIKRTLAKCWINISYQSKVVATYGLLSSINKTRVWSDRHVEKLGALFEYWQCRSSGKVVWVKNRVISCEMPKWSMQTFDIHFVEGKYMHTHTRTYTETHTLICKNFACIDMETLKIFKSIQ